MHFLIELKVASCTILKLNRIGQQKQQFNTKSRTNVMVINLC